MRSLGSPADTWMQRRLSGRKRRAYRSAGAKLSRDFAATVELIGKRMDETGKAEPSQFRDAFLELLEPEVAEARPVVRHLKELQTLLGELHHRYVLEAELAVAVEKAATEKARGLHHLALDGDEKSLRRAHASGAMRFTPNASAVGSRTVAEVCSRISRRCAAP